MIPFLTLFERKILSYIQLRKGPKKVRIIGIIQPINDGLKLFLKEGSLGLRSKFKIYLFSPLLNFFFMLILFILFVPKFPNLNLNLGIIIYLCISSLLVYTILTSG
jgi:NADH:ubiquinone oxidoreductase subunit H